VSYEANNEMNRHWLSHWLKPMNTWQKPMPREVCPTFLHDVGELWAHS